MLVSIVGVELVRAGTWMCSTGTHTFTPAHFASAVAAQEQVGRISLKLGHTDPRFDGEPAVGQVQNLRCSADGQALVGDLVNVPDWLAQSIPSSYPNRSIEGEFNFNGWPFVVTGLALLGATPPAIKTLADLPAVLQYGPVAASRGGVPIRILASGDPMPDKLAPQDAQASNLNLRPPTVAARCPAGEDPVAWGVRTGRFRGPGDPLAVRLTAMAKADRAGAVQIVEALASVDPELLSFGRSEAVQASDDTLYGQLFGETEKREGRQPAAAAAAVRAAAGSRAVEVISRFDPKVTVTIDPYGRNPLPEDYKQVNPTVYGMALKEGPPPTLFLAGDLPPFTASGIDPQLLLKLPWNARHAAAAETDRALLTKIFEDAAAPDGDILTALTYAEGDGAADYVRRVSAWASGSSITWNDRIEQGYVSGFGG